MFSECPAFITLIVSLVTAPALDDQIWMCFERWVQRTLKHKSLGNETPSVLDKKTPPSHHVIFCFLRSLTDSERRLMARHLDSSNAALVEGKCCTNPSQYPWRQSNLFSYCQPLLIYGVSVEEGHQDEIKKWRNEQNVFLMARKGRSKLWGWLEVLKICQNNGSSFLCNFPFFFPPLTSAASL